MLLLTLMVVIALVVSLPISEGSRNQVLALLGLILSGLVAFSSTTIVANLTAGIMLRVTKPFRAGDFIQINEHFGRISERGLLDTEIQTEHRDLIALPNTYLITNPVKTVRASGTIVSTTLSLGYDVHHAQAEELLQTAATSVGLTEPFVTITELGDYSVSYRVAGLLTEVNSLITTRSNLNRAVLDTLHEARVEIASPSIVNQRRLPGDGPILPPSQSPATGDAPVAASTESVAFDKADEAEAIERTRTALTIEIAELEATLSATKDEAVRAVIVRKLDERKERASALANVKPTPEN
ncbi:MAG: hypothetical protein SynsKO_29540 [Synoicihabitans sp.]